MCVRSSVCLGCTDISQYHPTVDQFIVIHQIECLEMLLFTCTYTMCGKMRYIWKLCRLTVRPINLYRGSLSVNSEYIWARTLWVTVRLISLTQGSWLFSLHNKQVVVGISKWSAHSVEDESAEWGVRTLDLLHTAGGSQTFAWGRPSNSFFTFVIGICKDWFKLTDIHCLRSNNSKVERKKKHSYTFPNM